MTFVHLIINYIDCNRVVMNKIFLGGGVEEGGSGWAGREEGGEGGREGRLMRGLGTDHVTSGPMRGLGKNCIRWRKQTDTQTL